MRFSPLLVALGLSAAIALDAPIARAASPDGIQLQLTETGSSITLHWTGSTSPYQVYRSTLAPTVTATSQRIATTNATSFVDTPPPGGIHYYVVTASCPTGTVACGSGCSALASDPVHCGTCGIACRGGKVCSAGACACAAGEVECVTGCADFGSDPLNCGACGIACGDGASCVNGACLCAGPCGNQPPTASAGADQPSVVDIDGDGVANVSLNGSASQDPNGAIVYEWREGLSLVGEEAATVATLPVGTHTITLTVTDFQGAADVDDVAVTVVPSSGHPRLVVRGSSFQAMRERAASEPWASMRADAIATSNAGYVPGADNSQVARNIIDFSSASALAYILDEPNARLYATRVRDAVMQTDALTFGSDWGTAVPPANALFNLTLALDVVYNHLTPSEVLASESKLQQKVNLVYTGDWTSAGLGAIGTWSVYKGTRTTPDNAYYDSLMSGLSLDGVFLGGRCYGWARWNGLSRYVKNMYMDVLEFTGIDPRYYQNPRIVGLYEWLYGHSEAIFGGPTSFGDCAIQVSRGGGGFDEPPLYRAEKFSFTAAQYAATHEPSLIGGNLLSYVVPDAPLPAPVFATSKVYPDGGGFFMEALPSVALRPTAMSGGLWNAKESEGHSHYEVNAIALAGYNEYLLVNAGYVGWGYGPPGYSWNWVHDDERSANTLRTSRHASKVGGGVVEGFTDALFDYASGNDGPALADDVHLRNFVFVHSDGSARAYFALFDEVAAEPGELIEIDLHPNTLATTGIQTNVASTEYTASIDAIAVVPGRAKLTVFYATPPGTVRQLNGGVATWDAVDGGFDGKYLESEYAAPANGQKNVLTILFPHDPAHAKATMSRITGSGFYGATIDHGSGIIDTAFESNGAAPLTYAGDTFTGMALLCRKAGGANAFYFVRKGTSFATVNGPARGFSATAPVSVYMRGTVGHVASPGRRVRFTYPQVVGVRIDGSLVANAGSGANWVEVDVPSGTHGVVLVVSP